ncbi:MAG: lipoprotein insertase outer membrane protein LolB [Gammaproteobacteria bacterium]|nr:lipoprotein insertase outer membrane protein LolB [Gammaproteobacteria bacterium]
MITLLLPFLFLFSACTTTEPLFSNSESQQSIDEFPENWSVTGRISVLNGEENWYAKFSWIQNKQDFQLSFTGPLGETELQVSQIAGNVLLKTPAKEVTGQELEQLLHQETGWELPVVSLRYWMRAHPNSTMVSELKYNKNEQISDIFQAGWHIQYPKRMTAEQLSGLKIILPKKIIATKKDIKVKLIITRWNLGDSALNLK